MNARQRRTYRRLHEAAFGTHVCRWIAIPIGGVGMDDTMLKDFMLNIVRQITLLDLDEMRAVNIGARRSIEHWDSIGVMLDPTAYRDMLGSGTRESAKLQARIVDHLIAVRELFDQLEAVSVKHAAAEQTADGGEG
jgi:hypothetical protein